MASTTTATTSSSSGQDDSYQPTDKVNRELPSKPASKPAPAGSSRKRQIVTSSSRPRKRQAEGTLVGQAPASGPDNPPPAPAGTPASLFAGHYVQRETDPTEYYFWVVHRETGEKQLAAIGRDELGTGKLVYSSVPDFDHRGLPRLWKQSRRELVEWLEVLGAGTPLDANGQVKKPKNARSTAAGSGGRGQARTPKKTTKAAKGGVGGGGGVADAGRAIGRTQHAQQLIPKPAQQQHAAVQSPHQLPVFDDDEGWQHVQSDSYFPPHNPFSAQPVFSTTFTDIVERHGTQGGQPIHLMYLYNENTGVRLLVVRGTTRSPRSRVITFAATPAVGGYQLQHVAEARQYAQHLLNAAAAHGPAAYTPPSDPLHALLATSTMRSGDGGNEGRAHGAATGAGGQQGVEQRPLSPHVYVTFANHPTHLDWIQRMPSEDDIHRFRHYAQLLIQPIVPDEAAGTVSPCLIESQALEVLRAIRHTDVGLGLLQESGIALPLGSVARHCGVLSVQHEAHEIAMRWKVTAAAVLAMSTRGLGGG